VQSQRYVKASNFKFVVPPAIEANERAKAEFLKIMEECRCSYEKIAELLEKEEVEKLKAGGCNEEKAESMAEKISIEDARYVLPNACETKLIVTMNARELRHFFLLRCCNRAQWEIREIAFRMLKLVKQVSPELFRGAGPGCIARDCREGKMSCGKAAQVREIYRKM
jgi:thymidylate synthase (FAD)